MTDDVDFKLPWDLDAEERARALPELLGGRLVFDAHGDECPWDSGYEFIDEQLREVGHTQPLEGGQAVIWKLKQKKDRRRFKALKVYKVWASEEGGRRNLARCQSEYELLTALEPCEACVDAERYGTVCGLPALLMDWIDGTTVDNWCQELRTMSQTPSADSLLRHVETGCRAIMDAVWELHDAEGFGGRCHGDLNPKNVMIVTTGRKRRRLCAKLIDFGYAVESGGRSLGWTPRYAAPEQQEKVHPRSSQKTDQWQVGRLMEDILQATGLPDPVTPKQPAATSARLGQLSAESRERLSLLWAVVNRMKLSNEQDRFESMSDAIESLPSTHSGKSSRNGRLAISRSKALLFLLALVVVVLLVWKRPWIGGTPMSQTQPQLVDSAIREAEKHADNAHNYIFKNDREEVVKSLKCIVAAHSLMPNAPERLQGRARVVYKTLYGYVNSNEWENLLRQAEVTDAMRSEWQLRNP